MVPCVLLSLLLAMSSVVHAEQPQAPKSAQEGVSKKEGDEANLGGIEVGSLLVKTPMSLTLGPTVGMGGRVLIADKKDGVFSASAGLGAMAAVRNNEKFDFGLFSKVSLDGGFFPIPLVGVCSWLPVTGQVVLDAQSLPTNSNGSLRKSLEARANVGTGLLCISKDKGITLYASPYVGVFGTGPWTNAGSKTEEEEDKNSVNGQQQITTVALEAGERIQVQIKDKAFIMAQAGRLVFPTHGSDAKTFGGSIGVNIAKDAQLMLDARVVDGMFQTKDDNGDYGVARKLTDTRGNLLLRVLY